MPNIKLNVVGLENVPSFKNQKMIARGRLITNPERQKWMERCTQGFVSQLLSVIQTIEGETLTGQQVQSWIACNMPSNDSRQWIPELHITSEQCSKGEEGATIMIERI